MGKVQRKITIDEDLNNDLKQRPYINVSAFCNRKLRDYVEKEKKQFE